MKVKRKNRWSIPLNYCMRGQVVGHPDKLATGDFLSFLDSISLQFWFGQWEHYPKLLRTKVLILAVIYWWAISTWLLPIQQSDQFGKITGWPNAVAMPQVIHFRIKFFETLCPCFDCPSAHSHPSFLMCLYVPGPHYLVNFFNLPYFTSQAGCFQQCLSGSDVNVRPTPQGLRIRLTWPLTFSLQIISSEFICTSM